MGGACVKLMFIRNVVFKGDSGAILVGAQGAAVKTGALAE